MDKIYRFMSFEAFVDMLIKKELTFVHPSLWDDPYELNEFGRMVDAQLNKAKELNEEGTVSGILNHLISKKIYAQSWTKINESDALWRIYSHNNTSIRISVAINKIQELEDVKVLEVIYGNNHQNMLDKENEFYNALRIKREAFSHEKEVRLLKHYKYTSIKDAKQSIVDFLKINGKMELFEGVEIEDIPESLGVAIKNLNYGLYEKTCSVSYSHIIDFIDSVMLNPFAPEWVSDTVKELCKSQNIEYLGKSKLYTYSR